MSPFTPRTHTWDNSDHTTTNHLFFPMMNGKLIPFLVFRIPLLCNIDPNSVAKVYMYNQRFKKKFLVNFFVDLFVFQGIKNIRLEV